MYVHTRKSKVLEGKVTKYIQQRKSTFFPVCTYFVTITVGFFNNKMNNNFWIIDRKRGCVFILSMFILGYVR